MAAMALTADVVIIGAGVIGSAAALELARGGPAPPRRVVVVDKLGGAGYGSTSASSAIIRFNYSTFDGVAASWEAAHCWRQWAGHLGAPASAPAAPLASFTRTGMISLEAPGAPASLWTPLFDAAGVPYELWDAATLAARVPGLDPGRFGPPKPVDDESFYAPAGGQLSALFMPDAGYVSDPQLAARNLADAARAHGASFRFHAAVTAVEQRGGRVAGVRLADGTRLRAPVVINAAGPWSGAVNRLAGVGAEFTIGVRPLRQEVHQVPAGGPGVAVADLDTGIYTRPAPGGFLLIGGTEPACDPLEWLDDPDEADPRPTAARFRAQVTRAARRLPGLGVPNAPVGIAGVYDVADDWTPIYDRTDLDGFYVAMGTSGNQFKNAPLAGRFLAALVAGVEAGHDHDRDPLRYRGEHTGLEVNLGAFSRKRPPNAASTGTVFG